MLNRTERVIVLFVELILGICLLGVAVIWYLSVN